MFTCDICKEEKPDEQKGRIYGKTLCSKECKDKAMETFTPSRDTNRGGGVGKDKVMI